MTHFAPWQRVTYFCGEALLIGGLLWALYMQFIQRVCAVGLPGVLQPFSLVIAGIALDTLPLHPFGAAQYLRPGLRGNAVGVIWWLLALAGLGFALYAVIAAAAPTSWWLLALVPAFLWYWTAVRSRSDVQPVPPKQAPPAPPRADAPAGDDENESMDKEDRDDRR